MAIRFLLTQPILVGLAVLTIAGAIPLAGQTTPPGPPDVDFSVNAVASGGHWQEPKALGYYRVLVVQEGAGAVRHRAFLQWIQITAGRDSIRQTLDLTGPSGAYSLVHPIIESDSSPTRLRLTASFRPLAPPLYDVVFDLSTPGQVKRVRAP